MPLIDPEVGILEGIAINGFLCERVFDALVEIGYCHIS
jgi:hypothetical protein